MGEILFKSHNIGTFQSLDSDVLNLCNKKFELHTVRKESVTTNDLKSVSVITEICKSVDSKGFHKKLCICPNFVFEFILFL